MLWKLLRPLPLPPPSADPFRNSTPAAVLAVSWSLNPGAFLWSLCSSSESWSFILQQVVVEEVHFARFPKVVFSNGACTGRIQHAGLGFIGASKRCPRPRTCIHSTLGRTSFFFWYPRRSVDFGIGQVS